MAPVIQTPGISVLYDMQGAKTAEMYGPEIRTVVPSFSKTPPHIMNRTSAQSTDNPSIEEGNPWSGSL